jgi:hypothetical protein
MNALWGKIFEIDRENPGILRKQPPFKILVMPWTSPCLLKNNPILSVFANGLVYQTLLYNDPPPLLIK